MNRMALLAVLLAALAVPVSAGETATGSIFTAQQLNGRGWMGLDAHSKVFYVIGLYNGIQWASTALQDGKTFASVYLPTARYSEIADGLDLFYADPANANVPVFEAFRVFRMRLLGVSKADIEKVIEEARKFAHEEAIAEH